MFAWVYLPQNKESNGNSFVPDIAKYIYRYTVVEKFKIKRYL